MADLSSLGTAEEIAAAAMAAAGLGDILGGMGDQDIESNGGEQGNSAEDAAGNEDAPPQNESHTSESGQGLKRSYDATEDESTSTENEEGADEHRSKRPNTDKDISEHLPVVKDEEDGTQSAADLTGHVTKTETSPDGVPAAVKSANEMDKKIPGTDESDKSKGERGVGGERPADKAPRDEAVEKFGRPVDAKPAPSQNTSASAALALLSGIHNLEAVAQAAMGLDAHGNPLPGNEESHRALAEAVKRLSGAQGHSSGGFTRTVGAYQSPPSNIDMDGSPLKRFQCHLCERAFARAYNLNTHLATHDPDPAKSKPFPCPYPSCRADGGRSFSRKHDLQRHVASTHENEPVPEDEEDIDENGSKVNVLAKLGLGTPGRKFRCDDCGRAFVRRDALKRHQCLPSAITPPSSTGSPQVLPASRLAMPNGNLASPSTHLNPAGSLAASGSLPSGLSLYTSTAPSSGAADGSGKGTSGQSLPTGLSYESLSREVQDMAMHLVAQATSYNQEHARPAPGRAPVPSNVSKEQG